MGKYRPLVSVIMNCYNSEEFLDAAIRSVFAQTYENWEIIFWDNASDDGSAAIAKKYSSKLRYFRGTENVPLGCARNLAIQQAKGELIAFLDCDDLWYPNRLTRGVKEMAEPKWGMCYAGIDEIHRDGRFLRRVPPRHQSGELLAHLLWQFDINIPTSLVRKNKLEELGLCFDPSFSASEEYNLFTRLAVHAPIATIPESLAQLRIHHTTSLTGRTISVWADERERTLNRIREENPGIYERHRFEFEEAYARAHYYRACYYVERGDMRSARKEVGKATPQGFRYRFLYGLSYLPKPCWTAIHQPWIKRKLVPRLLGLVR